MVLLSVYFQLVNEWFYFQSCAIHLSNPYIYNLIWCFLRNRSNVALSFLNKQQENSDVKKISLEHERPENNRQISPRRSRLVCLMGLSSFTIIIVEWYYIRKISAESSSSPGSSNKHTKKNRCLKTREHFFVLKINHVKKVLFAETNMMKTSLVNHHNIYTWSLLWFIICCTWKGKR